MSHNLAGVHKNRKHLEIQTNALYMVLWGQTTKKEENCVFVVLFIFRPRDC